MGVTANITVSFGETEGNDGHLSAEVDGRVDGLNGGKTSFVPGETAYFLVYTSRNVRYDRPVASAGTIVDAVVGEVEREEDLSFADTDTASLQVPATSISSVTWLGRSLGDLALTDPLSVKASGKGVAVARVKYKTKPTAHGIRSPLSLGGLTDFSVLVYILGHLG